MNGTLHRIVFLAFVLIGCCGQARATHISGGELTYVQLDESTYEVSLTIYRDCSASNANATGFDDAAPIGVYSGGSLVQTISVPLSILDVEELSDVLGGECAVAPNVCMERAVYTTLLILDPVPGGYTLVYQRCCRTPAVLNLNAPDDSGMTLTASIPGIEQVVGTNHSATFNAAPPAAICIGDLVYLDLGATDADGDSVSYAFCSPLLGGTLNQPAPNPPGGPPFNEVSWVAGFSAESPLGVGSVFDLNPSTGMVTAQLYQVGTFSVGMCVEEWREGELISVIRRDFNINVAVCGFGDFDGDGICDLPENPGCTDEEACNFDEIAIDDDGSCIYEDAVGICGGDCSYDLDGDGVCDDSSPAAVTFQVGMNEQYISPQGVFLGGTFEGWCGCTSLSDDDGDGVYSVTLLVEPGPHEWRFLNGGWDGMETLDPDMDAECTLTTIDGMNVYTNRYMEVEPGSIVVLDASCFGSCSSCFYSFDCDSPIDFGTTSWGVSPNGVSTQLQDAEEGETYLQAIHALWPSMVNELIDFPGETLVDSIVVEQPRLVDLVSSDTLTLEDIGLQFICTDGYPPFEECHYPAGSQACFEIFGVPEIAGAYEFLLETMVWTTVFGFPIATPFTAAELPFVVYSPGGNIPVTFQVDMGNEDILGPVYITGAEIDGWCGTCVEMTDVDGDGVYAVTLDLEPFPYEYKFNNGGWDGTENLDPLEDAECTMTTSGFTNRLLELTPSGPFVLEPVCFNSCNSCPIEITEGCTLQGAMNYNAEANLDDGSCLIEGCMEEGALNYMAVANVEGPCIQNPPQGGCIWDFENEEWNCSELCASDLNQDGVVNVPDLLILLGEFAGGCD